MAAVIGKYKKIIPMKPSVTHTIQQNEHLTSSVWHFIGEVIPVERHVLIENDSIIFLPE
jgi:hypothetical protein